jgi:putative transposase
VYRVHLTEAERQELTRRAHAPNLPWRTRDRLEMVRLSNAGFSIPKIAQLLRVSEVRVRYWIKRFLAEGFEALPDQPHLGQQSGLTPAILEALAAELQQTDRTWTAQQLADWVAEHHGLRLTSDYLARRLKRARLSYKRTARSLKHKQDPEQAKQKQAELATLEKGGGRSPGSVPSGRSGLRPDLADELQLVAGRTAAADPL